LTTENISLTAKDQERTYDTAPGKNVRVSVTDTGIGMEKKYRHRCWSRFSLPRRSAAEPD